MIELRNKDHGLVGQWQFPQLESMPPVILYGDRVFRRWVDESRIYLETKAVDYQEAIAAKSSAYWLPVQLLDLGGSLYASGDIACEHRPWVVRFNDRVFFNADRDSAPAVYRQAEAWKIDPETNMVSPANDQDPAVDLSRSIAAAAADSPCDCDCDCDRLDDIKDLISKLHSEIGDRLTNIHADICDANSALDDIAIDLNTPTPPTFPDSEPLRINVGRNPIYHTRLAIAKFAFSLAAGAVIATAILLVTGDRDRVVLPGMILAGSVFVGSWVKP